jgi:hypothetical protein
MPRGVYERSTQTKMTSANKATEAKGKIGTPQSVHNRTVPTREDENRSVPDIQYVALKPMKVNGVAVARGDIVPEANDWRNVHNYVSAGFLAIITS